MTPPYSLDRGFAAAQDAADPVRDFRDEFEHPVGPDGAPLLYLCGNSLGLMPKRTRAQMAQELDDWGRYGVEGHMKGKYTWYSYHEHFRDSGAALVGARPGEVVLMNTLTTNLHLMLVSFYRPAGRRIKVLMEEGAFPSDTYAIATHVATRGYDPKEAVILARPRPGEAILRTEDLEALIESAGDELALVLLPGIQYYSGQFLDLARLTKAAHRAGAVAGFDLAHAVGNVPLALHDWGVDFAVWCCYKYLNGGPGAVGGCFVHERHGTDPSVGRYAGWWGNDPATRFQMHLNTEFVPQGGAAGWQLSNPPIFSAAPLVVSLEQFTRAGMAALRAKSLSLTGYLEYLTRQLPSSPIEIITPSDPDARGCQLSLLIRGRGRAVFDRLRGAGMLPDYREPDVIRMAPVPLYNTHDEIWRVGQVLREVLG